MSKIQIWIYILTAVSLALSANYVSAIWASKDNKWTSPWLLAVVLISPFVFITFGLVVSKLGVTVSSGTIDSLLTISTILLGLFVFHELTTFSVYQFTGIVFAVCGIFLLQFSK